MPGRGRGAILGPFQRPQSAFVATGSKAFGNPSKPRPFGASAWLRFKRKQNECKRKQNECKNKNKIKIKNKSKGNCKRQFPLRAGRAVRSHFASLSLRRRRRADKLAGSPVAAFSGWDLGCFKEIVPTFFSRMKPFVLLGEINVQQGFGAGIWPYFFRTGLDGCSARREKERHGCRPGAVRRMKT